MQVASVDQETADRLWSNFNAASAKVKKSMTGKAGATAEKEYGIAYAALCAAGLASPLRGKYR